jgi:uncharacterized protein DUF2383
MLRDARQLAINQVVEALLEAAHLHDQGMHVHDAEPDLARSLRALAERRRRAARELGEHLRRLGDLPSEPDADLQAARDVLAWVQDALADDQRDQVLERSRQAEKHLAEQVRTALGEDLPSDTRALLEQLPTVPELRAVPGLI